MKAQRRHELQTNTLASGLSNLPGFMQQYGGRVITILIFVVLLIVVIRMYFSNARESHRVALENLSVARNVIQELRGESVFLEPSQVASTRRQLIDDATNAISYVRDGTDDRQIIAEALMARGDLNWLVANLPELPGAATQQALRLETPAEQRLGTAEEAYREIIEKYADVPGMTVRARLSLAAVMENRGNWEEAQRQYEAVKNDDTVLAAFRDQADARLKELPKLKEPPYFAPPTTAPSAVFDLPATMPALSESVESTQPTTAPVQ